MLFHIIQRHHCCYKDIVPVLVLNHQVCYGGLGSFGHVHMDRSWGPLLHGAKGMPLVGQRASSQCGIAMAYTNYRKQMFGCTCSYHKQCSNPCNQSLQGCLENCNIMLACTCTKIDLRTASHPTSTNAVQRHEGMHLLTCTLRVGIDIHGARLTVDLLLGNSIAAPS